MKLLRILMVAVTAFSLAGQAQVKYKNPVYGSDFPDPTVQRAKNGTFYSYATGCKTLSSKDLVHWTKLSNAIGRPTWNDTIVDGEKKNYSFWACDVSYLDGKYYMQYACALWGNGSRTGIGVAVGDSPDKFTDKGRLFRSTEIGVWNSIDPCFYQEKDKKYIIWGSFNDICIAELEDDGLAVKNFKVMNSPDVSKSNMKRLAGVTKIAGGAFEGPMIYKRGKYYYLFASVGSCCEGENSTYRTVVGRATNLKGPYVNKQGGDMKSDNYTTIIKGDDRFKGPGHNSEIITDDAGQDWLLYHSYDKNNGCNGRLMLLDRIDWVNDWPVINDGTPSEEEHDGPIFYTGDGANMTYKLDNADMSMSDFKYWNASSEGDCELVSSAGTNVFMPFARATSVQGGGTFDINQELTGMKNGIYELKVNNYTKGNNVDLYINQARTLAYTAESLPSSDGMTSTRFLSGNYEQSAYGIVTNGKLTLGMASRSPLVAGDRYAVGNVRLIYREKNVEAAKVLTETFAENVQRLDSDSRPCFRGYRSRLDNYIATARGTESDAERYTMLTKMQLTLDSIPASYAIYNSLTTEVERLANQIERAKQSNTDYTAAALLLTEAQGVVTECNYTDKEVKDLITRMQKAAHDMFYVYTQGDGSAESPYIIATPEQLDHMRDVLVKSQVTYFELAADIDMKDIPWKQLNAASATYLYWINFDGKGHIIFNLHNEAGEKYYPSFFGTLCGECRNVGFVDAQIDGTAATGSAIIAGAMGYSSFKDAEGNLIPVIVENCYVTGSVTGKGYMGAIAGNIASSPVTVRNVYSVADLNGDSDKTTCVGGLLGRIRSSLTLEHAYAAGDVAGTVAGGAIGGGQSSTTPSSVYNNVFAWGEKVEGTTALPFGDVRATDEQTDLFYSNLLLVNGEKVADGVSSDELRQKAATWGAPWNADPTKGNGYPILEWQVARGDYATHCGFPALTGIDDLGAQRPAAASVAYDLQGRRVDVRTATRGIYLIDGKKVIR